MAQSSSKPTLFNATEKWANFKSIDATRYLFENHINETNGMSKMNPGFHTNKVDLHPKLTGHPDLGLTDWIVKNKMFNFFLWDGCIPFTEEYKLME